MHSLFSSRYLKLFTGDVQRRLRRLKPDIKDQNPEGIGDGSAEPFTFFPNEDHGKNGTEGNLFPDEEENQKT